MEKLNTFMDEDKNYNLFISEERVILMQNFSPYYPVYSKKLFGNFDIIVRSMLSEYPSYKYIKKDINEEDVSMNVSLAPNVEMILHLESIAPNISYIDELAIEISEEKRI